MQFKRFHWRPSMGYEPLYQSVYCNDLNQKCFCTLKHSVCSYKKFRENLYIFWGIFDKTIIPLVLVNIYLLIFGVCLWNNCYI